MPVKTDNPRMGRPVTNKHKVPARQWARWSNTARRTFNHVYAAMQPKYQWKFLHLKASIAPYAHWNVLRWNVAWCAAEAANGDFALKNVK